MSFVETYPTLSNAFQVDHSRVAQGHSVNAMSPKAKSHVSGQKEFLFHSGSDMEVDSKNGSGLTN